MAGEAGFPTDYSIARALRNGGRAYHIADRLSVTDRHLRRLTRRLLSMEKSGILDDMMADAIGAKTRVAVLPQQTRDQARKLELPDATFRQLAALGDSPEIIVRVGDGIVVFTRNGDGEWIGAIIERTANGQGAVIGHVEIGEDSTLWQLADPDIGEIIFDRR